jgi:integrase
MDRRPLPKFVQAFLDRHGTARYYFRRPGYQRVALPGMPYSPEFMAAYTEAMAGQVPCPVVARPARPGTINALAISYLGSTAFRSMSPNTQAPYRNFVARFCKEHGDFRVDTLQRDHILRMMGKLEKPGSANRLRKVLRAMMQHAVDIGMRSDDPTRDVKAVRVKSDGYHSWTEEEIAQFEDKHPIGSRARLAQALLLYTGQRRGDVIGMGRQHARDGVLHVKQQKTGTVLSIPVHPHLQEILDASVTGRLEFLVNKWGKPWSAAGFTNWFSDQCTLAGLRNCSAHGLRKAAARRLAEAGCTEHEIAAITGHASLREVQRYTKAASQKQLAAAAMQKVRPRTEANTELSNHPQGLTKRAKSRE